jgi:hypothetical protein
MNVQNCKISFIDLVKFVRPEDLANVDLPASERRLLPLAEGGTPSALQIVVAAPDGTRFTGFTHRGPRVIDKDSASRWAGKPMEDKFLAQCRAITPSGGTLDQAYGQTVDCVIDIDAETGEGSKELQWTSIPREGVGANLLASLGALGPSATAPTPTPA